MLKNCMKIVTFISLIAAMASANADIIYQADGRYVDHTKATGPYTPAAPFADFTKDWWAFEAGTYQSSALTSSSMSGTGSTYAGYDAMLYGAHGISVFSVTFGVDTLSDFSLDGSLDTNWYDSSLYVSLLENGNEIFGLDAQYAANPGLNPFNFAGQFTVGNTYELVLLSSSFDSDYYDEEWQFNLTTSPVPVPAAAWLFGSGLLGLASIARRKAA